MVTSGQGVSEFRLGPRHTDRHFRRGFGSSVIKNLTELITNSDAEYWAMDWARTRKRPVSFYGGDIDRLVTGTFPKSSDARPIIVVADSRKRRFQVIDHGRGFPVRKMEKTILRLIGEDMAQILGEAGEPKRSLFGEGLSAVMWVQKRGNVKSIVDDHLHELRVRVVEGVRKWGKPRVSRRRVQRIQRLALHVPSGNGTLVEFDLDPDVSKHWPGEDSLLSWLNNYWALRLINLDPSRQVKLIYIDAKGGQHEQRCTFRFPSAAVKVGDTLEKTLVYEGQTILARGSLWKAAGPLHMGPGEERRNGLLVIDDNDACYDLQFFGFDQSEHTARLFGVLALQGVAPLIRKLTNQGEEVLRDDRDGLNRKHQFYKRLANEVVDPWLKPIVDRQKREWTEPGRPSSTVNRLLGKALKKINKVYEELTEPEEEAEHPTTDEEFYPKDGLEFVGSKSRTAAVGTTTLVILAADPTCFTLLPSVDVNLESDDGDAEIMPQEIMLAAQGNAIVRTFVKVMPKVAGRARISGVAIRDDEATVETAVNFMFEDEAVPEITNGMAFYPATCRIVPNRRHALRLYVRLDCLPIGSVIDFNVASAPEHSGRVVLEVEHVQVAENCHFVDSVAQLLVYVIGYAEGPPVTVRASTVKGLSAEASVEVGHARKPTPGKVRFGLPEYRPLEGTKRRTQWDNDPAGAGAIIINSTDPINRLYFGESVEDFKQALDDRIYARLLLAELMMEEIVLSTFAKADNDGKVGANPTKADATRNYCAAARERYGVVLHEVLLSKSLLRKLGIVDDQGG